MFILLQDYVTSSIFPYSHVKSFFSTLGTLGSCRFPIAGHLDAELGLKEKVSQTCTPRAKGQRLLSVIAPCESGDCQRRLSKPALRLRARAELAGKAANTCWAEIVQESITTRLTFQGTALAEVLERVGRLVCANRLLTTDY